MARQPALLDALFSQIEREGRARTRAKPESGQAQAIRTLLMPCQAALEADPARHVSVRSSRRTGKSTGILYLTTIRCLENPGSRWVVVCLTRTSEAMRTYTAGIQVLSASFELGVTFHKQALIAHFPNGSEIKFVGADNMAEVEKLRGGQFDGVVVDECKSYPLLVFKELLEDAIEPTLLDRNGVVYVVGTPGEELRGEFYLATAEIPVTIEAEDGTKRLSNHPYGTPPGEHPAIWSLHQWTLQDNVTLFKDRRGQTYTLWDKALEVKSHKGLRDDNPTWRREYLGQWVAADSKVVYRYKPHRHDYTVLPPSIGGWKRVIGFDFGTRDGTAIVVWAYSDTEPGLWELYSEKRRAEPGQKLTVRDIAEWYREVEDEFGPFEGWPADYAGLATMVMDTLADEYHVYLEKAEKKEKADHIQLFNADLDAGLVHYRRDSELARETIGDRWDPKTVDREPGKRVEDPETPNDLCDAALYAFRWCRHRQAKPTVEGPAFGTPAWWAVVAAADLKAAQDSARRAATMDPADRLDQDWWQEKTP